MLFEGVAIGGGWQGLVANINLASYYAFGLPLGYILGYVANFGVMVVTISILLQRAFIYICDPKI